MYSSFVRRVLLSTTAKARPRAGTAAARSMTSAVMRTSGRRAGMWALGAVLLGSAAVTCLYEPTRLLAKAKTPPVEPPKPIEVKQIVEHHTGISFSSVLPSDAKLKLVGCGCRKKYGIAKIYAVGIYVDSKPAGSGDEAVDQLITSGKQKRAVLLKMYREVGPDQMIEALESSLKPRLSVDPATPASAEALNSLAQLRAALSKLFGPRIKVGTEILFEIDASAKPTLHLTVAGAGPRQDLVGATDLSRSLMDVYLSKTSVIPNLRAEVIKALASL